MLNKEVITDLAQKDYVESIRQEHIVTIMADSDPNTPVSSDGVTDQIQSGDADEKVPFVPEPQVEGPEIEGAETAKVTADEEEEKGSGTPYVAGGILGLGALTGFILRKRL